MPIYEYVCDACEHGFEQLVMGRATPSCPACRSQRLRRKMSSFAVGGQGPALAVREPVGGGCGTCGDPRGPGACAMDA